MMLIFTFLRTHPVHFHNRLKIVSYSFRRNFFLLTRVNRPEKGVFFQFCKCLCRLRHLSVEFYSSGSIFTLSSFIMASIENIANQE
jgi:hypothetical protein